MLWLLISGFFAWLVLREFTRKVVAPPGYDRPDPTPVDWSFVLTMGALAVAFAWPPLSYWSFEKTLTAKSRILSENPRAKVHCNTVVDTFLDRNVFAAGHARPDTGEIVFQHPWCGRLMDHLADPAKGTREGIFSVQLFVHEAMHIRGEMNESVTECQAIQRYYRGAKLLGVPDHLAKAHGRQYYEQYYSQRAGSHAFGYYWSPECAPGKALDERLADSTWN